MSEPEKRTFKDFTTCEWNDRNRANIKAARERGAENVDVCPECHAVVEVRYQVMLGGWLMQARKGPEHTPKCSAYLPEFSS